jgi:phospholipid/cholesterol/gamma-HCH transport system substrate-binding protein
VVVAVALIAIVVALSGASSYTVHARFVSASQLVKGNEVKVAGETVGSVDDVALTDNGLADVTLSISADGYHPLRRGTRAIIRQASLSGVANRYVDLQLGGADQPNIKDGGALGTDSTQAAVDLDQIFNTFDPKTRAGVSNSVRFLRDFQAGSEDEANAALRYVNPALSSSSRLLQEVNRDTPDLQRFVDETAKLVTDVSARDDALAGLVRNLATTASALTSHGEALGESVGLLPNVLRKADSTFVDLRGSLDDLTPLVDDAKPIVKDKLIPCSTSCGRSPKTRSPRSRTCRRSCASPAPTTTLSSCCAASPPSTRSPTRRHSATGRTVPARCRRRRRRSRAPRRS